VPSADANPGKARPAQRSTPGRRAGALIPRRRLLWCGGPKQRAEFGNPGTPTAGPARPRSVHPPTSASAAGSPVRRTAAIEHCGGRHGAVSWGRRHEAGQAGNQPLVWIIPGGPRKPCGRAFPAWTGSWTFDLSLRHGEPVCRLGVTPSDACGLGRASSSAKGWVLAMLARKGELRRGSGPARERAFLSSRLCPAKETAPEGADAGTTPARFPGQREGSRP
jgi:hypothetical protein